MHFARGITRTVLITRRYAVKFPSLRRYGKGLTGLLWSVCRGILANQAEVEAQGFPMWKGYLCPILWSSPGCVVIVMPRCEPLPTDEYERAAIPLPKLEPPPGDDKADNWGLLDGRPVRIDYDMNYNGCPHDRSGARNRTEETAC